MAIRLKQFVLTNIFILLTALYTVDNTAFAAVVQRNTVANRQSAIRANKASRMPTVKSPVTTTTERSETVTPTIDEQNDITDTDYSPETDDNDIIENKSDKFTKTISKIGNDTVDTSNTDLAEQIRRQRAALDMNDSVNTAKTTMTANACDNALRKCMKNKCGNDFLKCSGDGDTIWGDKMNACRRDTKCTAHEFSIFATEIKADRDINLQFESYNAVIDCGNQYNNCIISQCGNTFEKCLSKKTSDNAITKCSDIAKKCIQSDNGLATRIGNVFSELRVNATKQVQQDEKRLYELRDLMASQCKRLGAMFDERTLDCVYTVNFFAGDDQSHPYASKKLYAGDTFACTTNWFGIDVTTFKENAYRETRAQTSASSAMLGSGIGIGVGSLTSGAVDRAIETKRAKDALDEANGINSETELERKQQRQDRQTQKDAEKAEKEQKRQDRQAQKDAEKAEKQQRQQNRQAQKEKSGSTNDNKYTDINFDLSDSISSQDYFL